MIRLLQVEETEPRRFVLTRGPWVKVRCQYCSPRRKSCIGLITRIGATGPGARLSRYKMIWPDAERLDHALPAATHC